MGRELGLVLPSVEPLARVGLNDALFARRAVASILCCIAQHNSANWVHHRAVARLAFALWSFAVNLQAQNDAGKPLQPDEAVRHVHMSRVQNLTMLSHACVTVLASRHS